MLPDNFFGDSITRLKDDAIRVRNVMEGEEARKMSIAITNLETAILYFQSIGK